MYLQLKDNGVTVFPLYTEFNLLALKLSEVDSMSYPGVVPGTLERKTVLERSGGIDTEKAPP